jgi:SAM-dependent methyltransferase
VDENQTVWTEGWDWSARGEEWSRWWGGSDSMWRGALLPRLHAFLPASVVLEIAPGYGRWTTYLKDVADRLVVVDLAANCIEHCQRRFADATNIEYHVNDGRSLAMVADGSVDLAFSFDSLVHVEADVLLAYLEQLAHKLSPDGVGWVHHSNAGSYRTRLALARRVPSRLLRPLIDRGVLVDIIAWRAESVTADGFAELCERAGLACISQESIVWEHGPYLIDTISVFTRRGSRWDRPRRTVANRHFRAEASRMAQLYSPTSFPGRSPDAG